MVKRQTPPTDTHSGGDCLPGETQVPDSGVVGCEDVELMKEKAAAGSKSAALRLIAAIGDLGDGGKSAAALSAALSTVPALLLSKLGTNGPANKHWGKYSPLLRSLVHRISSVLSHLPQSLVPSTLSSLTPLHPLMSQIDTAELDCFCREVISLWAKSELTKVCSKSLQSLLAQSAVDKSAALQRLLSAFLSTPNPPPKLLQCCSRLLSHHPEAAKSLIALHLKQTSNQLSGRDGKDEIVCWEFVNLLGLVARGEWKEKAVEMMMAGAEVVAGEFRWAPFRLALIRHLITLERTSSQLIPGVSSHLFDLLSSPELHKRTKPSSSSSFSLYSSLDLGRNAALEHCKVAVTKETCNLLLQHLAVFGECGVFRELCAPAKFVLEQLALKLKSTAKAIDDGVRWEQTPQHSSQSPMARWRSETS